MSRMSTKKKMLALACSLSLLALAGCGGEREAEDTTVTGAADTAATDVEPVGTLPPADTQPGVDPGMAAGQVSEQGRQFLATAMASNQHEIEAARMGQERAQNADVKAYAERMVRDHTQLGEQLRPLAEQAGVTVAPASGGMPTLETAEGEDFDRAFMEMMVADHERAVADFERAASDPSIGQPISDAATQALPTLEGHLEEARNLSQQVGGATDQVEQPAGG